MRKTILIGILVLLPAALVAGGSLVSCADVTCGTGTHEEGGKCVASLPNTCGPGTYSTVGGCIPVGGSPCGPHTTWDNDAGICVGTGGGGGDIDGGVSSGARWDKFQLVKPEAITSLANIQLPGYFASGSIVVILRADPTVDEASVNLHGGDGLKTSDDPITYTFKDGFKPAAVLTYLDAPVSGFKPFHTGSEFEWVFQFIPGQPPLYLYKASVSGSLNEDGIPVSTQPTAMYGTIKGCFTPEGINCGQPDGKCGAADVYIEVITQDLKQLIENSGGTLDAECFENGGVPNGYLFEANWEANEVVQFSTAAPDAGV
jgi:hypothetical protein